MTLTYVSLFSGIEAFSVAASRIADVDWRPVFFSEIDPFPCAVLAHRFPSVPNLGDVSKIRVEGNQITNGEKTIPFPEGGIDIIAGGSPCFVGGTMVLTPSGYVPIETLRVGDKVVGGSGAIRTVEAVGSRMAKVGTIKVLGRPEIVCTPNHPFMCVAMKRDNRRKSETYARMIPVGDFSATREDESIGKYVGRASLSVEAAGVAFPKCYFSTNIDIAELAGWYLGDGYIRRFTGKTKKTVVLALVSRKKIDAFSRRFNGLVKWCECNDGKIAISCTALADWLISNFGEGASNKRVPYWCYAEPWRGSILQGYQATDGCVTNGARKFCTTSPALAYGIADLCGHASVEFYRPPETTTIQGRTVNQRPWFSVVQHNETVRTKLINGRYASRARSYNGATGTVSRVYNITVGDDHTYIANGLYVHNCQDVSVAGLRKGMSEGSGTRSSLAFEYARLVEELRPRIILWENVPGVLSSRNGLDFRAFLGSLVERGYCCAWRVLDAQFTRTQSFPHAVPQRRRRVWLVGCLGTDESVPAQILSLCEGLRGDPPPRRETGKGSASPAGYRADRDDRVVEGAGRTGESRAADNKTSLSVAPCRTGAGAARGGRGDDAGETQGTPRTIGGGAAT